MADRHETFLHRKAIFCPTEQKHRFYNNGIAFDAKFQIWECFRNFENFTDRRQSRFSPLVMPPHDNPEFPEIYAPTDGFIFSVGIIIKPFGNEDDD